jgi:hypothetical protein
VVQTALDLLNPKPGDILYDIGAGDGNFLIAAAQNTDVGKVIGIEICPERVTLAIVGKGIDSSRCEMRCGNALEENISDATCLFLYLVPRGLRILLQKLMSEILPNRYSFHCLLAPSSSHKSFSVFLRTVRIVTYMSPFPANVIQPLQTVHVSTQQHGEARWPLFYYEVHGNALPSRGIVDAEEYDPLLWSIPMEVHRCNTEEVWNNFVSTEEYAI